MAGWGNANNWGDCALWGLSDCESGICEFIQTRILSQMDSSTGNRDFRDFMCIHAEPFGKFVDVAQDVGEAFNIDTAVGVQLDIIGSVIDLPRSGFTDDEFYRKLLKIQATILQGQTEGDWTGSVNQILQMVRTFIGPVPGTVDYLLVPPYSFELTIPVVLTGPEFAVLFRLLCRAIYAGVLGYVVLTPTGDNLWDSQPGGVVTNGGVWCSHHGAVANCAQWSGLVVTSSC